MEGGGEVLRLYPADDRRLAATVQPILKCGVIPASNEPSDCLQAFDLSMG